MAAMSERKAEAYLRQQIAIQADVMRRRGIEEGDLALVLRGLEGAIRAELFRCMLLPSCPKEPA
jgi:uncharacterized protein DUF6074